VKQHGCHANIFFSFYFYGDNCSAISVKYVKFGMEVDHKHAYKFMHECNVWVNSYKYDSSATFWGYIQQI
jgi:hypothetical protein